MTATKVRLSWRGDALDFEFDRENMTVGELGAMINQKTGIPVERITVMVSGWKLKKFGAPNGCSAETLLRECTTAAPSAKGVLMGTPEGQEFKLKTSGEAPPPATTVAPLPNLEHGYINLGNTCYMNSVLAMLERCTDFATCVKAGQLVTQPLGAAWQQLWSLKQANRPANPRQFFSALCSIYPSFGARSSSNSLVHQQQDADECLTVLFNNIPKTGIWRNLFQFEFVKSLIPAGRTDEGDEAAPPQTSKDESFKISCYPGTVQQPVANLTAGMALGFEETVELDGQPFRKKLEITEKLPKYMIVHIVRFEWKKANDLARSKACRAKVLKRIEYPETLDIYQFCDSDLKQILDLGRVPVDEPMEKSAAATAEEQRDSEEYIADGRYKLKALITHKGRTVEEGHYICWSLHDNHWVKLDDDRSSEVPKAAVDLQGGIADGHSPYILLYERVGNFIAVD